jgi:hypothetical protein
MVFVYICVYTFELTPQYASQPTATDADCAHMHSKAAQRIRNIGFIPRVLGDPVVQVLLTEEGVTGTVPHDNIGVVDLSTGAVRDDST